MFKRIFNQAQCFFFKVKTTRLFLHSALLKNRHFKSAICLLVSSAYYCDQSYSASSTVLTKSFIADAVAVASPSVVSLRCINEGIFGLTVAGGSGFIISEVFGNINSSRECHIFCRMVL